MGHDMVTLWNTLSRAKEALRPSDGAVFRMYECGMTPSGEPHIGHARTAVVFDTLKRWLRFRGTAVRHVRNVTDVEDKIIAKAAERKTTPEAVVAEYDAVRKDLFARLNLIPPDEEPYATRHIPEILGLIGRLVANGLAYPKGGDVYFRVRKFPGYGRLSGNTLDDLVAGARVHKEEGGEDPLDFVLWKGEKPGEPAWDSPWGRGRPGWHIECSAMSMTYLGETFDLHGGGRDLVFPHHENEIAQSEGATGKPFALHWAHPGWVTLDHEKMSKSAGNVLPLRDVLARLPTAALRLLIAQTHWRSPFEWSDDQERQAVETLRSLERQLELPEPPAGTAPPPSAPLPIEQEAARRLASFDAAMDDDLSTPRALAEIFPLARALAEAKPGLLASPAGAVAARRVRDAIRSRLSVLGIELAPGGVLRRHRIEVEVPVGDDKGTSREQKAIQTAEIVHPPEFPAECLKLAEARAAARASRNWALSDALRAQLKALGWVMEDTPAGQVARKA
jgi:cysteinyl-tRNA synthetase